MTAAAVLFDMDGLLVDSEPLWYLVETEVVAELGGTWGPEHQQACLGGTIDNTCRYIAAHTGTDRPIDQLRADVLQRMAGHLHDDAPVHDGAVELVDAVRAAGVRTALVSSSYRVLVDAVLDAVGADRFDVTVSGDEVTHGKPHPEPYLTACARLGVEPARAVVLEDSVAGVAAAEAAGCVVVAVPSLVPIEAGERRRVVPGLRAVDVGWLLALAG